MENNTTYTKTFSIDLQRTNYHLKMKKRKIKRIIIVIMIWLLLIVYLILPFSKINLKVSGNVYYSHEDLKNMAYINEKQFWWLFNKENAIKTLKSYEFIDNVNIKKSPFKTEMIVEEIYPLGVISDNYVYSNGSVSSKANYPLNNVVNDLTDFSEINSNKISDVVYKFNKVPLNVRKHIDSIEIETISDNYDFILLDGYDDKIGYFTIKTDLEYLNTKFNENKYNKIIEEVSQNKLKYSEDSRALIAYLYPNEEEFHLVDSFKGD